MRILWITTSAPTTPSPSSTATSTTSPGAKYAFPATDPLTAALTKAISAGEVVALPWNDADVPALAHLGETDLISSALERSAASQTVAAGAATDTAWVEDLDSQTLSALPASTTTLIAPASAVPVAEDLTYTPREIRIEAPVNGGRNYNGPKVAKFLVR